MDLMEAISNRRSIRKFKAEPVKEDDLREIIAAAIQAPNASNKQMWKYVAVTNREIIDQVHEAVSLKVDALVNACETLGKGKGKKIENHKFFWTFFRQAPAIIAVFACPYYGAMEEAVDILGMQLSFPVPVSAAQQSIGAAVQNISLAAHAKGYGTTWMYGPVMAYREIGSILGVPAPWTLSALLPIGIPDENPKARPRKPLEEVYCLLK